MLYKREKYKLEKHINRLIISLSPCMCMLKLTNMFYSTFRKIAVMFYLNLSSHDNTYTS